MQTFRELKNRFNNVNIKLAKKINKKQWPLYSLSLKKEVITLVEDLQQVIAELSSEGKQKFALKYVEYFCFSLIIRIYVIEKIKTKKNKENMGINLASISGFNTCWNLVRETHPKNVKYTENVKIKYIKIPEKKTGKINILEINYLIDWILQIQFYILLDPLIDITLPELSFGFRKGRNANQVLTYLSDSINFNNPNKSHLLCLNINKCSDIMFHKYILEYFPFPKKHKKLLVKWLKLIRFYKNYSVINSLSTVKVNKNKLNSRILWRWVLYPLIINVILAKVLKNFFNDRIFQKWPKKKSILGKNKNFKLKRYIINYVDDIKILLTSKKEVNYAKNKVEKHLVTTGTCLNTEEVQSYDLSKKVKFNWLGYTFLIFLKKDTRYTKLVSCVNKLTKRKQKTVYNIVFLYITNEKFKKVKQKLKSTIQELKHLDLYSIMKRTNVILRSVAGFYSFFTNVHRLNYLDHFVHKVYWRILGNKFRYKGLKQIKWVVKNFFVVNKRLKIEAPLKAHKWQLHTKIPNYSSQIKTVCWRYLWCVKVTTYYRMQLIRIMGFSLKGRNKSPYIDKKFFEFNRVKIMKLRQNGSKNS